MFGKKKSETIAIFFLRVVISDPEAIEGAVIELELEAKDEMVEPHSQSIAIGREQRPD